MFIEQKEQGLSGRGLYKGMTDFIKKFKEREKIYNVVKDMPVNVPVLVDEKSSSLIKLTKKRKEDIASQLVEAQKQIAAKKVLMDKVRTPIIPGGTYTPSEEVKSVYSTILQQQEDIKNQQELLEKYKVEEGVEGVGGIEGVGWGGPILRWENQ
jgi:PII-like signaling protein